MSAPLVAQFDGGVAVALGAIVATAAMRKFQHPRVVGLTLERLEPTLIGRRRVALRLGVGIAAYEAVVGAGVVAWRGTAGFVFACGLLVACAGFLAALGRAMQRSVPCACFGRLGRTAAGGREMGRAIVMTLGAGFLVVHRAIAVHAGYGIGPFAVAAFGLTLIAIAIGRIVGRSIRPGVETGPEPLPSLAASLRDIAGFDNDLYTAGS